MAARPAERPTGEPPARRGERARRRRIPVPVEIAAWVVGFIVWAILLRGLAPVVPGAVGALRALAHPVLLLVVFALVVLWRMRRPGRGPA